MPNNEPEMHEVTRVFEELRDRPEQLNEKLFPLVYSSMKRIAVGKMKGERPNVTLQPTILVHDAYMRLVKSKEDWQNRRHFLGCAARAMEQILIEHARKRGAQRRGSGLQHEILEEVPDQTFFAPENVLFVHTSLARLEEADPLKAEIVKLRYYAGATIEEIARYMEIGETTAKKHLRLALAWLKRDMNR